MNEDWAKIYDEHALMVRRILFRMCPASDVDDLMQDCFIKIWKNLAGYRKEASAKTWVTRIAINTAYDHHRRKGARPQTEEFDETMTQTPNAAEANPDAQSVLSALASLSLDHREVLVLQILEENSIEEVAEILAIAPGTVKSRLFHAREKMKQLLLKRGVSYG